MRSVSARTRFFGMVALTLTAITIPIASSGCGRTACFVYTKAEYDAHEGSCPAVGSALPHFADSHCPGPVVSVDGPGFFNLNEQQPDESLCCYPVTQRDIDREHFNSGECTPPGGFGGGFGGVGGSFGSGVAVGGSFGGCLMCSDLLKGFGTPDGPICDTQVTVAWQTLQTCACTASAPCATVCSLNLCKDAKISQDCRACLQDVATSGCAGELDDCKFN